MYLAVMLSSKKLLCCSAARADWLSHLRLTNLAILLAVTASACSEAATERRSVTADFLLVNRVIINIIIHRKNQ